MAGLSYGDYTADEAADVLIDGITGSHPTVIKKRYRFFWGCCKDSSPVLRKKTGVNMDFDKTIGGYLENTGWKGRTDIGCLLNGCRQMYAATQDER